MSSTSIRACLKHQLLTYMITAALGIGVLHVTNSVLADGLPERSRNMDDVLSGTQQAVVPIAAFAAAGDLQRLNIALNQGLDAGMTVSDCKEILIQVYAYAGFPRSLNALAELMEVLESRKARGVEDLSGTEPSRPIPSGQALVAVGIANQTELVGAPVVGGVFEFAPTINDYLRAHLFGSIFERDNFAWQSRELATLGMLSVMQGTDPQLHGHMRISMNIGLTAEQLRAVIRVLADRVGVESAGRASQALEKQLAVNANR